MILDRLKELANNNQLEPEYIEKENIQLEDLMLEIRSAYDPNGKIDFGLYNYIPTSIMELYGKDLIENNTPFTERATMLIGYVISRGLPQEYCTMLSMLMTPAEVILFLESLISSDDKEYLLLEKEYNRYVNNSLSFLKNQMDIIKKNSSINAEELNSIIDSLKEIIPKNNK